jgi:hypothetical protein
LTHSFKVNLSASYTTLTIQTVVSYFKQKQGHFI